MAPCCGENSSVIQSCRLGLFSSSQDALELNVHDRHVVPRHEIKLVQQDCSNCGACLGKYFCAKCNLFDDDVSKNQFHCDGCELVVQRISITVRNAVAASPMPAICQKKMIWILCNDCGMTSNVQFHILAHKCPGCSSYNTRQTRGDPAACSRV
ncbi:hypothetical protein BAE44_0005512 [Dichanthelium oligosanthes]|uniref:CTCHY-type domain-containing protein n=1 Tax=Dichanthelium oligosanthes TaxID=888268 RepID=A0A1E5W7W0_9POAL|nr:hypothetical protein BAE44_0005512 [Dichanthelium oligosanthes]